jgi:threonine/homoserine/homoserine lactone efflux protein
MPTDLFLALINFAVVTSITPGPNNIMLLASGVNHGLKATLPHILGIAIGFGTMLVSVGLGLHLIFDMFPFLHEVMRWVGIAYLLYLTWGIATAAPPSSNTEIRKPMTILGAALFQVVNVKAWIMAIGAFSTYVPANSSVSTVLLVALTFVLINMPTSGSWAVFGASLRRYLLIDRYRRIFNYFMALLLLYSTYEVLVQKL